MKEEYIMLKYLKQCLAYERAASLAKKKDNLSILNQRKINVNA